MSIIEKYVGATFDPEAVQMMGQAYDRVVRKLQDRGQPTVVQEVIAKRVTELASIGERDADRLAEIILGEFGIVVRA